MLLPTLPLWIILRTRNNVGARYDEGEMGHCGEGPESPNWSLVSVNDSLARKVLVVTLIDDALSLCPADVDDSIRYLNLYYRRTRRLDVPLISAIRVLPEPPPAELASELEGWVKANGNLHSGIWPTQSEMRLWYQVRDQDWDWARRQEELSYDYGDTITELDVVYGDDEAFFGFERVEGGPVTERKADRWESVDLAFRRGNPSEHV